MTDAMINAADIERRTMLRAAGAAVMSGLAASSVAGVSTPPRRVRAVQRVRATMLRWAHGCRACSISD
ncbi:hypothetical protein ACQR16_23375 [Bradyrhizobium oligotrophicum]|uniref:hypothetical protein n=1 Tax=Bradyrhizobium oligotrophicum TaxID=44255 RepID=UPI003EBA26F3